MTERLDVLVHGRRLRCGERGHCPSTREVLVGHLRVEHLVAGRGRQVAGHRDERGDLLRRDARGARAADVSADLLAELLLHAADFLEEGYQIRLPGLAFPDAQIYPDEVAI